VTLARRPVRTEAEWDPFMTGLRARLRRERRRRRMRHASVALLCLALLWLFWGAPRRRGAEPRLLAARVPDASAPRFEPVSGTVKALPSGALLVRSGGGS